MANKTLYTVGGAVQVRDGFYVPRKADAELLDYCLKGEYVYVLCPRQVGKSSLMYKTAKQLNKKKVNTAIVDLGSIGGGAKIEENHWYHDIFSEIVDTLNLKIDLDLWWDNNKSSSTAYKLTRFFNDVVLNEIKGQIVIFIDEIDTTLRLKFVDDFFIAIRSFFNARVTKPELRRLSFVLIGTATPTDFIKEPSRTPFNIGQRVDLADFSFSEALPLSAGLAKSKEHASEILEWVFEWTNGHPYLTQKICAMLSQLRESKTAITKDKVSKIVQTAFGGMQDGNLQFVRTMLLVRAKDSRGVMKLYQQVLLDREVSDSELSINKSHLKLSGVVRVVSGYYRVSNKIYENAFNLDWVIRNTPQPKIIVFLAAQASFILLLLLGYFVSSRQPTYILFAIWAAICLLWTTRLREMLSRIWALIRKPIVIYKDPEPESIPFYPRTLLEDGTEGFRNSLTDPFSHSISLFMEQIRSLTNIFNKNGHISRLFGYIFFLAGFIVFVSTNLAFIADTLDLIDLAFPSQRLFPYSYSIFALVGTMVAFIMGLIVVSETRTSTSQLSAWSDRNTRNRSLIASIAVTSVIFSIISLLGWYFFRLVQLGDAGNFDTLTLNLIYITYYILIPINMLLSAFITISDAIRGLIVLLIILEWSVVGLLFVFNRSLTILATVTPILFEILYRAIYISIDVAQWLLTTPMHVAIYPFRSLARAFTLSEDEIPSKSKNQ